MITDKTVGALVSNSIFERYANAGGEIDIQALIDAAQAGSPMTSNLTQTELWEVLGIFGYSGEENTSITSLVYNPITTFEGLDLEEQFVGVLSFVAPNLVSVGDDGFIFLEFPNVQTILFPVLQHCKYLTLKGHGTSPMTSLDLSLLSVTVQLVVSRFPNLTTINLNDAIYTSDVSINFQDNALSAEMVNSVIASVRASGINSYVVNLSLGTSAPPTGQGVTDYKYLLLNNPSGVLLVNWIDYSGSSDADFLAASGNFGTVQLQNDAYINPTNALIENIFNGLGVGSANLISFTATGLVFVLGNIAFGGNSTLTTVSFPNVIFKGATDIHFAGCALLAASVNHILARCVASIAYLTGTNIDISGGTNAAPTGQGIIDKQTLIDAGLTVTTN